MNRRKKKSEMMMSGVVYSKYNLMDERLVVDPLTWVCYVQTNPNMKKKKRAGKNAKKVSKRSAAWPASFVVSYYSNNETTDIVNDEWDAKTMVEMIEASYFQMGSPYQKGDKAELMYLFWGWDIIDKKPMCHCSMEVTYEGSSTLLETIDEEC